MTSVLCGGEEVKKRDFDHYWGMDTCWAQMAQLAALYLLEEDLVSDK